MDGNCRNLSMICQEIVTTGTHKRLEGLKDDPEQIAINLFNGIWGSGPATSRGWVARGLRTLDDVLARGNPTKNQLIGIRHYDDLILRMPRTEVRDCNVHPLPVTTPDR